MSTALYSAYKRQERLRLKRKQAQLNAEMQLFTRNIKQKTTQTPSFAALMIQATNENVALSTRVTVALELRQKIFRLDMREVVRFVTTQQHLAVKLADALLHTSYVPLQQLFIMSLASLLTTLNDTRGDPAATTYQRVRNNLRQRDKILLNALPMDEAVDPVRGGENAKKEGMCL